MIQAVMRVLFVTERFTPDRGGAAVSAARQAAGLAPRLERLDVLLLDGSLPPGRSRSEDHAGGGTLRIGRAPSNAESLQLLCEAALNLHRAHRYDLFHGFYAVYAGYVAALAARRAGVPCVVSLRGNDVDRCLFDGKRLPMLRWALESADAVAGVSQDLLDKARALTGRGNGLWRISNGVDAGLFSPDGPLPEGLPSEAPRPWIAFSGELRLKKGLPLLLDLAELMGRAGRGTLFALGGARGECAGELESWRRRQPAASRRLRALPYEGDPARLAAAYRAMDLFVFPSLWEGMPNALLEAMACGKPVLASAVGAFPEVLRHGENGFLLPAERLAEFPGEALRVAAMPQAELDRIGRNARLEALSRYTPEAERDAILTLYRRLLPARADRARRAAAAA